MPTSRRCLLLVGSFALGAEAFMPTPNKAVSPASSLHAALVDLPKAGIKKKPYADLSQWPVASPTVSGVTTMEDNARIYDYVKACNPVMPAIPVLAHPPELHQTGPTRVIPFDLSKHIGVDYTATSPNLLASYIRILPGQSVNTNARATSQAFYVIRGSGSTQSPEHGTVNWNTGDLFVFPASEKTMVHTATKETAIYWVNDEPLLRYLGVSPSERKFEPTLFKKEKVMASVETLKHEEGAAHKNRLGVLLGNKITESNTQTLTHTLWSLLNLLPAGEAQRPHRHNSVALDLCTAGPVKGAYTLMGPELGPDGWVKDPIRVEWAAGACFVTPPGWWHSHHNDSPEDAWVLPLQDAGLLTHMRTLDIQFSGGVVVKK